MKKEYEKAQIDIVEFECEYIMDNSAIFNNFTIKMLEGTEKWSAPY